MGNKEEELSSLIVSARCGIAQGAYEEVMPLLDMSVELLEDYDTEGFAPVVYAWRARVLYRVLRPLRRTRPVRA